MVETSEILKSGVIAVAGRGKDLLSLKRTGS